jgi:hypothetical protein
MHSCGAVANLHNRPTGRSLVQHAYSGDIALCLGSGDRGKPYQQEGYLRRGSCRYYGAGAGALTVRSAGACLECDVARSMMMAQHTRSVMETYTNRSMVFTGLLN